jgi:hypothetical protein
LDNAADVMVEHVIVQEHSQMAFSLIVTSVSGKEGEKSEKQCPWLLILYFSTTIMEVSYSY